MSKPLQSFQILVSIDPKQDLIPSHVAETFDGGYGENCPVSLATKRALNRRFRRWQNTHTQTLLFSTLINAKSKTGKDIQYYASLPKALLEQRKNYDRKVHVEPASAIVTFKECE